MAPRIIIRIEEYDQRVINALDATLSRFGYSWWGTGFSEGEPAHVVFIAPCLEHFCEIEGMVVWL